MLYKFLHSDGYEVQIKDLDSFIGYVNTGSINENSILFDEGKQKGIKAYEVREFRIIFDKMRENGWSLYVVPKAVEKGTSVKNYGLKEAINDDKQERIIVNYEKKKNVETFEINEQKDISEIEKWSTIQVNMSKNTKMFLGIASTIMIFLAAIILMVTERSLPNEDIKDIYFSAALDRIIFSFGLGIILTFILTVLFFRKRIFVAYMCFAIVMFVISSVQFVDSVEKNRLQQKNDNYKQSYIKDNNY